MLLSKRCIWIVLFLLSCNGAFAQRQSAITFQAYGRLGDKLFTYCKAKWLAYKYGLPFLCPDFSLKNKLMMADTEHHLAQDDGGPFKHIKKVVKEQDIQSLIRDTLFKVDFYFSSHELPDIGMGKTLPDIGAIKKLFNDNPLFLEELRLHIAPRRPLAKLILPENQITVAVHVRRGSGGDKPLLSKDSKYSDVSWPDKFPPDSYYIDQIRRLDTIFNHQPMYVHLFTDFIRPEEIAQAYTQALNAPHISFGWHQANQSGDSVIEDLFAMMQFDCLIRSSSYYSCIPYLLGEHVYMISAAHGTWHQEKLHIDKIFISHRHEDDSLVCEYIHV